MAKGKVWNERSQNLTGFWKGVSLLFTGLEVGIILGLLFFVSTGGLYFLTYNIWYALIFGVVITLFFFVSYTVPNRRLKRYQYQLDDCMNYVTNMTYYLQTGQNVLQALKSVQISLGKDLAEDVGETIKILEDEAVLNTDHFSKYDFPSLDQFHKNLLAFYEQGGNPRDLFELIQINMLLELKKRDELYKKRMGYAISVYTIIGMGVAVMVVTRVMTADLWMLFLEFKFASLGLLTLTLALKMVLLHFLNKAKNDISVRV